jgi:pimeloyl-ACP methyl ester carboxylesterase
MKSADYMEQELLSIPFSDSKIDAIYFKSLLRKNKNVKEPVVIHVHGFLGNFLDGSQRFLPPILARAGYSSLSINTRMATFGLFFGYGIIDETVPQIDTVISFLKNLGYSRIILSGYSLGASIMLRYISLRSEASKYPSLKAFIGISTPFSTPESIKTRWDRWDSVPSYEEVHRRVRESLKPDPYHSTEDRTIIIYRARGDTLNPEHTELYTYKTWWYLAGPEAEAAKCDKQIGRVKVPILLIQGSEDDTLGPDEARDLACVAREAGNEDATALYLKANHTFESSEEELGSAIVQWLDERFTK